MVVGMWTSSYASGQQDAAFSLVMENQSQQGYHKDKDDGAADDGVGDARVVTQAIVQCHKVLARSFCAREEENEEQTKDA